MPCLHSISRFPSSLCRPSRLWERMARREGGGLLRAMKRVVPRRRDEQRGPEEEEENSFPPEEQRRRKGEVCPSSLVLRTKTALLLEHEADKTTRRLDPGKVNRENLARNEEREKKRQEDLDSLPPRSSSALSYCWRQTGREPLGDRRLPFSLCSLLFRRAGGVENTSIVKRM